MTHLRYAHKRANYLTVLLLAASVHRSCQRHSTFAPSRIKPFRGLLIPLSLSHSGWDRCESALLHRTWIERNRFSSATPRSRVASILVKRDLVGALIHHTAVLHQGCINTRRDARLVSCLVSVRSCASVRGIWYLRAAQVSA